MKRKVGDDLSADRGNWSFSDIDQENFESHISKSVPGYKDGHRYITFLSDYFISKDSLVYDIGCSTGNLLKELSVYHKNKEKRLQIEYDECYENLSRINRIE